jgi:hypothetical protein
VNKSGYEFTSLRMNRTGMIAIQSRRDEEGLVVLESTGKIIHEFKGSLDRKLPGTGQMGELALT